MLNRDLPPLIVLSGPTGTGKSELAVRLALEIGGEVVNADSIQVYSGFDIGSAKPGEGLRSRVPHHLYDVVEPDQELNASDFAELASKVCLEVLSRKRLPIVVGGTGFYLRSLLTGLPEFPPKDEGLRARLRSLSARKRGPLWLHYWLRKVDPVSAARISQRDRHRLERALEVWLLTGRPISAWQPPTGKSTRRWDSLFLALSLERDVLLERLDQRVSAMYEDGLVGETKALLSRYPSTARAFSAIGYREAVQVAQGTVSLTDAIAETRKRTRAYAKRQMTWLRAEHSVHWLDASRSVSENVSKIRELLAEGTNEES